MALSIYELWLASQSDLPSDPGQALAAMHRAGLDAIALPGSGATLARWSMLAAVSAWDLSLAKLYEAHTDALAILAELSPDTPPPAGIGGVWAAEVPGFALRQSPGSNRAVTLTGKKAWCSGAGSLDWALVTTWGHDARPSLSLVDLKQKGVAVDPSGWHAVGMSRVSTSVVEFEAVPAQLIGAPGAYLDRPGFWHGGAGIAACWYGASTALADQLMQTVKRRARQNHVDAGATQDPYRLAHLGAIDVALSQARAMLVQTAQAIDVQNPSTTATTATAAALSSQQGAMRVRAACEWAASTVLDHVGKALGATPYCADPRFARMAADLPVFLRQSHAEHDLAALALLAADDARPWTL